MHLLQVCNVGQIVGGTAACAWSITRALPQLQHSIAFLSRIDDLTRRTFQPHQVIQWSQCTADRMKQIQPDLVILHNVAEDQASRWNGVVTVQYVHSVGRRLTADHTLYCSRWLSQQSRAPDESVLWQGVPLPPALCQSRRRTPERLRIGRICTPTTRKWPDSLCAFYAPLSLQFPAVDWDFVGCPQSLQPRLQAACQGRATFLPAGWLARSHVWEWDALLYHHPTLTESFGRTVAEAARAGCIPIVDRRGGFPEQLDILGRRGCDSLAEFAESISELSAPDSRIRISQTVQQQANTHFSLSAFGDRLRSRITRWAGIDLV